MYRKIVSMNEALRKKLCNEDGVLTPLGRKEYMKKRLGQFERAPRVRRTDADYTPRVKPPKDVVPSAPETTDPEEDEGAT